MDYYIDKFCYLYIKESHSLLLPKTVPTWLKGPNSKEYSKVDASTDPDISIVTKGRPPRRFD